MYKERKKKTDQTVKMKQMRLLMRIRQRAATRLSWRMSSESLSAVKLSVTTTVKKMLMQTSSAAQDLRTMLHMPTKWRN